MIFCFGLGIAHAQQKTPAYKNQDLPVDKRVEDLLKQLTVEEKISLIGFQSRPV